MCNKQKINVLGKNLWVYFHGRYIIPNFFLRPNAQNIDHLLEDYLELIYFLIGVLLYIQWEDVMY